MDFDPTKKLVELSKLRRPIGRIIIEYDPNTGKLGFNTEGLTPVEEFGCVQFFQKLRYAQLMEEQKKNVQLAPADALPPRPA